MVVRITFVTTMDGMFVRNALWVVTERKGMRMIDYEREYYEEPDYEAYGRIQLDYDFILDEMENNSLDEDVDGQLDI